MNRTSPTLRNRQGNRRVVTAAHAWFWVTLFFSLSAIGDSNAQQPPTQAEILRGQYGRFRANNDLIYYHLDIRVDPERKFIDGNNTIKFRMLSDDDRIQLDLYDHFEIERIVWNEQELKYQRDGNAVFVEFPQLLPSGTEQTIVFYYRGSPKRKGRFGGIMFDKDPAGRPWITTSCEDVGSSFWWPGKDQWRDEVESMDISVAVPNGLMNVSNGRFVDKVDLGDGYTQWNYHVSYPINSYNVSINVGNYVHFGETLGDLTLDYYVLPEDLPKAEQQFRQVKPMMEAFLHYFGEYPFARDGYKLIQVPYTGMEHQSAVTYGNGFQNGYYGRDWTGVGVSMKFDFIIIHESAHEWFGNAVSAADVSDMWIHEGWTTYLECLYVERIFGYADALKYVNGYKNKVLNRAPIITERGSHQVPPADMYFKGALFLHTLRNVLDDDARWWSLVRETYETFKYKTALTEDLIELFNRRFEQDLTPIFRQYLWHTALPQLDLKYDAEQETIAFRWVADVPEFNMPIKVGKRDAWQTIRPTTDWQTLSWPASNGEFEVATDLYYIRVSRQ